MFGRLDLCELICETDLSFVLERSEDYIVIHSATTNVKLVDVRYGIHGMEFMVWKGKFEAHFHSDLPNSKAIAE